MLIYQSVFLFNVHLSHRVLSIRMTETTPVLLSGTLKMPKGVPRR